MSDPTPALAPEWARKMADTCTGVTYDFIALLLASVRDAALREAGSLCFREAVAWDKIPGTDNGNRAVVCEDLADAILALVGTAPKPTESAPVSEANEEADRG